MKTEHLEASTQDVLRSIKKLKVERNLGVFNPLSFLINFCVFKPFSTCTRNASKTMMVEPERPAKRVKLLSDSEGSENESVSGSAGFKVNEAYAKRFEHNKKREEKHRLEEKYQKPHSKSLANGTHSLSDEEDSESDTSEDDEGDLATKDVDAEIFATLEAIKKKDPRVYDTSSKFYADFEAEDGGVEKESKKEKPMYLHDYHRQNLLSGHTGEEAEQAEPVVSKTYAEDQDGARNELLRAAHASAEGTSSHPLDGEDDLIEFKHNSQRSHQPPPQPTRPITDEDIARASHDPETYLSNFMASRAWVPTATSRFTALDSDDSDDERRAEKFEEAYNMRFEDPATANETLKSFSRDLGKYGLRRDEKTGRQRARDREREGKEAAKRQREEERARLRKLKIEEAEEKVRRIKDAAGLRGREVRVEDWRDIIDADFDDDEWDREMTKRFGEEYYAEAGEAGEGEDLEVDGKKNRLHKPKWNNDIEINDLVPDFEKEENGRPAFTLSSDDDKDEEGGVPVRIANADDEGEAENQHHPSKKSKKSKKDRENDKREAKRNARLERRQIEDLVDTSLPLATAPTSVGFQYRPTSPLSFGLSSRDILFADDSQLNQYAGLKKMAAFRDEEKKRKDRKRYSKKARLREWRRETFGGPEAPEGGFEKVLGGDAEAGVGGEEGKARSRKKKRNT